MPVTLAQAKLNVQDDLQAEVIDEYAKSNFIWEHIILTTWYPLWAAELR